MRRGWVPTNFINLVLGPTFKRAFDSGTPVKSDDLPRTTTKPPSMLISLEVETDPNEDSTSINELVVNDIDVAVGLARVVNLSLDLRISKGLGDDSLARSASQLLVMNDKEVKKALASSSQALEKCKGLKIESVKVVDEMARF
ncbi:unnamed protein product [Ilex paraguariensis]|uniref:Uncharacterized protein n=1 Tax=Ilex paraguariensis TaxID=185542 RepID=A0ABC8THU6_9AQUA